MIRKLSPWLVWGALSLGGLGASTLAQAGSNVYWSVGMSTPGVVGVQVGNVPPVVVAPMVQVAPAPVYVQQPVYLNQPVYYPAPVRLHAAKPRPSKPAYRPGGHHRPGAKPMHKPSHKPSHKPGHRR